MTGASKLTEANPPASTVQYFDQQSTNWAEKYRPGSHFAKRLEIAMGWLESDLKHLRAIASETSPQYLDYGCGSGVITLELLRRGGFVTAVDRSTGMLASCQAQAEQQLKEIAPDQLVLETVLEDTTPKCFERQYDGVFCLGVLEYVDAADTLLLDLANSVKSGGQLYLSVPNQASGLRQLEKAIYTNRTWLGWLPGCAHLTGADNYLQFQKHQFNYSELKKRLESAGLSVQDVVYHVAPSVLKGVEGCSGVGMTMMLRCIKTES